MLRIFICPKCFNYRIVSRKPEAICFHCGAALYKSDLEYVEYADMSEKERARYKEKFIKRMKAFRSMAGDMLAEQDIEE